MDEIIFAYSRAEAIADGVLVDASTLAKEAGFVYPVALTSAVYAKCVEVPSAVDYQDETGRLWDILSCLRFAIARMPQQTRLTFLVDVQSEPNRIETVELVCVCGPGDTASPVLTIMFDGED